MVLPIADIEVLRQGDSFVARIRFAEERTAREYRADHFEGILEQVAATLTDRFEETLLWQ